MNKQYTIQDFADYITRQLGINPMFDAGGACLDPETGDVYGVMIWCANAGENGVFSLSVRPSLKEGSGEFKVGFLLRSPDEFGKVQATHTLIGGNNGLADRYQEELDRAMCEAALEHPQFARCEATMRYLDWDVVTGSATVYTPEDVATLADVLSDVSLTVNDAIVVDVE